MPITKMKLLSPVGAESIVYNWPLLNKQQYEEIIQAMKLICEDLPVFKASLENNILSNCNTTDLASMELLCNRFNRAIKCIVDLEKGTSLPVVRLNKYPSVELLQHVLQMAYSTSVVKPIELNHYEPFSPEVYGEISYDLINQIIEKTQLTEDDIFIDLGSGVGQVVLQVAALVHCKKCYGIEKEDIPNKYAEAMSKNFDLWLKWFGKNCGHYELIKGDFLSTEHREIIHKATVILVNNLAFGPVVDNELKEIFIGLKNGTKIISFKNLCPLNFRITERNLTDIGAIVDISKILSPEGSVSWTSHSVPYFLHVVNHKKLETYWETIKKPYLNHLIINKIQRNCCRKKPKKIVSFYPSVVENKSIKSVANKNTDEKLEIKTNCPKVLNISNGIPQKLSDDEVLKCNNKTPATLDLLLDNFKTLYQEFIEQMKEPTYKFFIENTIKLEMEKNNTLKQTINKLEEKINIIANDGINLLKTRMNEVGINPSPYDLFAKSKELIKMQEHLQLTAEKLKDEITSLEVKNRDLVQTSADNSFKEYCK